MATRESLIEGTLAVLASCSDMDGLTVDRLASELKMSKSTLYKYFDGLDDLVYGTVEHLAKLTDEALLRVEGAYPEQVYHSVAAVYVLHALSLPTALLAHRHKLQKYARIRLESTEDRLGELMFRAVINMGHSDTVAYAIRSAFDGAVRFGRTTTPDNRAAAITQLSETLIAGLC